LLTEREYRANQKEEKDLIESKKEILSSFYLKISEINQKKHFSQRIGKRKSLKLAKLQ
jgi:hypothetical protein